MTERSGQPTGADRKYDTPRLVKYGPLRTRTTGGSGPTSEGMMGTMMDKRP
jgi:hypothetical protein